MTAPDLMEVAEAANAEARPWRRTYHPTYQRWAVCTEQVMLKTAPRDLRWAESAEALAEQLGEELCPEDPGTWAKRWEIEDRYYGRPPELVVWRGVFIRNPTVDDLLEHPTGVVCGYRTFGELPPGYVMIQNGYENYFVRFDPGRPARDAKRRASNLKRQLRNGQPPSSMVRAMAHRLVSQPNKGSWRDLIWNTGPFSLLDIRWNGVSSLERLPELAQLSARITGKAHWRKDREWRKYVKDLLPILAHGSSTRAVRAWLRTEARALRLTIPKKGTV